MTTDTATINFARIPMIETIRCLIDVHGENSCFEFENPFNLEDNDSAFTSEFVLGHNWVADLSPVKLLKEDGECYVICNSRQTDEAGLKVRLTDLSLENLEHIMSNII